MIVRISRCLYHVRSNHRSLRTSTVYITAFPRPEHFAFSILLILLFILMLCSKFPFNYKLLLFSNCFMMNLKLPNWLHKEVVLLSLPIYYPNIKQKHLANFMLDVMHGSIIFDLLPFPPPAYPRGFAIFFFLGSLFPTPGHAERDYNYNPELLIDHIYVFFGTSFKEQYLFPYIENFMESARVRYLRTSC